MLAKLNDRSERVAEIQRMLNAAMPDVPPLETDGAFGVKTEARVRSFQQLKQLKTDGIVGEQTWNALCDAFPQAKSALFPELNIRQKFLTTDKYFAQTTPKHFITLHHTASNGDPEGVINYWQTTNTKVATHFVIGGWGNRDGEIWQALPLDHWAWHLGCDNQIQNELSVSIELCNWGFLNLQGTKFYNYVGREVPNDQVCGLDKPFRGNFYFQKYTTKQIESTVKLCKALSKHFWPDVAHIDSYINLTNLGLETNLDFVDFSKPEYRGAITSHTNFRKDKTDVFPQSELLKAFSNF